MAIRINHEGLMVPVSKSLIEYLSVLITNKSVDIDIADSITFNFRDPTYNCEDGGFHPVEIRIEPDQNNEGKWSLCYIADFRLVGVGIYAELTIDADFNFELNTFKSMLGSFSLSSADEYYSLWEANFITYAKSLEVFNIDITEGD